MRIALAFALAALALSGGLFVFASVCGMRVAPAVEEGETPAASRCAPRLHVPSLLMVAASGGAAIAVRRGSVVAVGILAAAVLAWGILLGLSLGWWGIGVGALMALAAITMAVPQARRPRASR